MADRHKYEYAVDVDADTAPAHVVRLVGRDKRVLEVGAGPGSITRLLSAGGHCRVTALEIDTAAIVKLAPHCERVLQADLNGADWPQRLAGEAGFDVVVAADVLEHLYEPLSVLARLRGLLAPAGYLVVSLPHVAHAAVLACLIDEDFEYRDWGLLDRTHIRFFGLRNMQRLFEDAGLKIVDAEFVVRDPAATEFADRWRQLAPAQRAALGAGAFSSVYQVVIKAVPVEAPGVARILMTLPVPRPPTASGQRWKAAIGARLSPTVRARLRRLGARLGVRGP